MPMWRKFPESFVTGKQEYVWEPSLFWFIWECRADSPRLESQKRKHEFWLAVPAVADALRVSVNERQIQLSIEFGYRFSNLSE